MAGIITAVVGLLIAVLSLTGVVPGITSTGVALILFGGLMIGLNFVKKPETEGTERMSTPSTLGNIFFSPGEVFQNLRRHPRWLVALLVMSVLSAVYSNAFIQRLTPEVVANYAIDKTLQMSMLNDEARAQIERGRKDAIEDNRNPVKRAGQAINGFVAITFWMAFIAVLYLLFAVAMGGKMNFWQAFSVAVYASFPVAVLRWVLSLVFLYIKDPSDIHPLIGQGGLVQDNLNFLVNPADSPAVYVLLSSLSILAIYGIILSVIGLKNAGERVSGTIAWTATIVLWIVGVMLQVLLASLFPSFLS
jgi:hypothetical protein